MKKSLAVLLAVLAVTSLASFALAKPALADNENVDNSRPVHAPGMMGILNRWFNRTGEPGNLGNLGWMMGFGQGVIGIVSSVNGSTITVTSHGFGRASSTPASVFNVDAFWALLPAKILEIIK